MQVYNVEIFDSDFLCVCHNLIDVSEYKYEEDYINYGKNSITIPENDDVAEGNLVIVSNESDCFFGIVKSVEYGELMKVYYAPFYSLFDTKVLFDTDLQSSGDSLEVVIKTFIEDYFVNNTDSEQNIPYIGDISIRSNTTSWGFNIKSDVEDMHMALVGFYSSIICGAFNKYGIVVRCIPDLANRQIDIDIGTITSSTITIETQLKNIINADINVGNLNADVNKLIVFDETDYTNTVTYYLHSDGTYDTTDSDRVTPVKEQLKSTAATDSATFEEAAASCAADVFGGIEFKNNMSIQLLPDDELISPKSIKIGQKVYVIHNGTAYSSILSKREIDGLVTLTFGSIRTELTYLLKGGYFNE